MLFKCCFILLVMLLFTCSNGNLDLSVIRETPDIDWWKTGVFYQIYPRSFKDSNADGIGDLNGITSKLDDLKEAGITSIWLTPIYDSGGIDQGYDILDFEKIDPEYGTMVDFDRMVYEAHDRDIKVILDFVPNHSSNKHEWFKKSEMGIAGYEDFYVWRDGKVTEFDRKPPNNWLSVFHDSAWEWSDTRNMYYLHQFAKEQPDLNYANPRVKQAMEGVLKFWLDKNVDGFRVDAVPFIFEDEQLRDEPPSGDTNAKPNEHESLKHIYTKDQVETYELIYEFRAYIDQYNKQNMDVTPKILMAEAYTSVKNTMKYYEGNGKQGIHIPFNFFLVPHDKKSGAKKIVESINEWLNNMPKRQIANWGVGNHDVHRAATRFGPELVDNINILIGSLSGIMVTYNGEEIGQEDGEVTYIQGKEPRGCKGGPADFHNISRDFERTPYHWDDSKYAGFTDPTVASTWLPVSRKHVENNLKGQKGDPTSHYEIYKFIVNLRKEKLFKEGTVEVVALSDSIIKVTRGSESDEYSNYVVLINISEKNEKVITSDNERELYEVVYSIDDSIKKEQKIWAKEVEIAAYKTIVFKVIAEE